MQKSVLITGCSSGIGLESALELKRQGFWVLAACRKPEDVERMRGLGLPAFCWISIRQRA